MNKSYCVYTHGKDGKVLYVGSGKTSRAFSTYSKCNRGSKYEKYVELFGKLDVNIVELNLTKEKAVEFETELYNRYFSEELLNMRKPSSTKELPSRDYLDKILYYDETSDSCLRWKISTNNVKSHEKAGCLSKSTGYWQVGINGKLYLVHRLILILHGIDLGIGNVVDHIDNDRTNNSISNLRIATQAENMRNKLRSVSKNSGFPVGVRFDKNRNRFIASVSDSNTQTPAGKNMRIEKLFPVSKYGYEEALRLAIQARKQMLADIECIHNVEYSKLHKQ